MRTPNEVVPVTFAADARSENSLPPASRVDTGERRRPRYIRGASGDDCVREARGLAPS